VRRSLLALVSTLGPALALGACSLPPLRGKAEIGKDAYAVFAADAPGGTDLFAVLPTGGAPIPLTFSPVEESDPALSPDGATVLFLRHERHGTEDRRTVWLLNLLSGVERELVLPPSWKAVPERAAWSADGRSIYVRTSGGAAPAIARFPAPPGSDAPALLAGAARGQADSSFLVLLGSPAFASVTECGDGLCTIGADGASTPLASPARDAARWGPDSVGYFTGDRFAIRPLGPGRPRVLQWSPAPANPRRLTFFPGRPSS
jgi:hypothetical protein